MNIKMVLRSIIAISLLLLVAITWPAGRVTATGLQSVLPLNIEAVANSERDFSGVQGDKNWFYGYYSNLEPLYPLHGNVQITINLTCPNNPPPPLIFNIWIDPSGLVINTLGEPIGNATVSLHRSDTVSGTFTFVASGSGIMSPANRVNPMLTDNAGYFGWDVIAGYYKVRVEKSGCVAANNRSQAYVQTEALSIPPPVTDLRLVLFCGEQNRLFLPSVYR